MAVVGEMHVGKGREEKEKRKGRGSEGTHALRARFARRAHFACDRCCVAREMLAACASRVLQAMRRARDSHVARISRATGAASRARCSQRTHLAYDRRCVAREIRTPRASHARRSTYRKRDARGVRISCTTQHLSRSRCACCAPASGLARESCGQACTQLAHAWLPSHACRTKRCCLVVRRGAKRCCLLVRRAPRRTKRQCVVHFPLHFTMKLCQSWLCGLISSIGVMILHNLLHSINSINCNANHILQHIYI